jgi:hypothetical protein
VCLSSHVKKNPGSVGIHFFFYYRQNRKWSFPVPESNSGISFSKFSVSRHLLKLFYDENTQFFYLLCSQFRQKASGWINKTLLLIKQHITYMNISRYTNIDKFLNIRYTFLLARRAYSWLFQLAQMWKLLAPGVGLGDFLTPGNRKKDISKSLRWVICLSQGFVKLCLWLYCSTIEIQQSGHHHRILMYIKSF